MPPSGKPPKPPGPPKLPKGPGQRTSAVKRGWQAQNIYDVVTKLEPQFKDMLQKLEVDEGFSLNAWSHIPHQEQSAPYNVERNGTVVTLWNASEEQSALILRMQGLDTTSQKFYINGPITKHKELTDALLSYQHIWEEIALADRQQGQQNLRFVERLPRTFENGEEQALQIIKAAVNPIKQILTQTSSQASPNVAVYTSKDSLTPKHQNQWKNYGFGNGVLGVYSTTPHNGGYRLLITFNKEGDLKASDINFIPMRDDPGPAVASIMAKNYYILHTLGGKPPRFASNWSSGTADTALRNALLKVLPHKQEKSAFLSDIEILWGVGDHYLLSYQTTYGKDQYATFIYDPATKDEPFTVITHEWASSDKREEFSVLMRACQEENLDVPTSFKVNDIQDAIDQLVKALKGHEKKHSALPSVKDATRGLASVSGGEKATQVAAATTPGQGKAQRVVGVVV